MNTLEEIKARIDLVDLVSETVQLRRSGKNYTGFCPFHPNTRTPAFVVFPETNTWRCFGQCNEGGDIFGFVMKKEAWDFSTALRYLAERAGVQLRQITPEEQAQSEENEELRLLLEEAVTFYRHHLLHTPAGEIALDYLHKQRGLSHETLEAFGIGYAPGSWEITQQHLLGKGFTIADLQACGLVSEREDGSVYDRFRNRVMFPIRDDRGRMAGFGARVLNPDDLPKFLNSPQTVLFDKGHLLYGLDRARRSIRALDQVIIVEGYLDVIALHQAGFANVVSPMGTALTEAQLQMIKRYSKRIVLALDADAAGSQATLRGLQIARQALDREQEPVFDARGLLGYEARLQADIRVCTLPDGLDPDEIVNQDPQEWQRILETAQPVVTHVIEILTSDRDLEDAKVKVDIANQVLPLIDDLPNPIERDTYRQQLARLLRVDERSLVRQFATRSRSRRSAAQDRQKSTIDWVSSGTGGYGLEVHCLSVLIRRPEFLYRIDRDLQAAGLSRLSPEDFQHTDHQKIFQLLRESIDQDLAEPIDYILSQLSLSMMQQVDELLEKTSELDPNEDRVYDDLLRGVLGLKERNLRQDIDYLRFLMEESQKEGDIKTSQHLQSMVQHTQQLKNINQAIGRITERPTNPRREQL